jgi:hypothetical protein
MSSINWSDNCFSVPKPGCISIRPSGDLKTAAHHCCKKRGLETLKRRGRKLKKSCANQKEQTLLVKSLSKHHISES